MVSYVRYATDVWQSVLDEVSDKENWLAASLAGAGLMTNNEMAEYLAHGGAEYLMTVASYHLLSPFSERYRSSLSFAVGFSGSIGYEIAQESILQDTLLSGSFGIEELAFGALGGILAASQYHRNG